MLVLRKLSLNFLGQTIFDDLNFSTAYDKKIGILGRNGSGKSTLLKVIAGLQQIDSGSVNYDKKKRIAYLPQESIMNVTCTVYQQVLKGFGNLFDQKKELESLQALLESNHDGHQALELVERYQRIQQELLYVDFAVLYKKAEEILEGLGFTEERWQQPVASLSVGWQMRVMLTQLLLQDADFYLFDEPTNHLDLPTKEWFVSYLKRAPWGYFLVTHDRYFLEHACDQIFELAHGKARLYHGNFSFYIQEKEVEQQRLRTVRAQQEKEIEQKQRTIDRFRASATKASMVQSMIKELKAIQLVKVEPELPSVHFSFPQSERAGKVVLQGNHLAFCYGDHRIFKDISFEIHRGQKIALIAPNGVGKTTLFNVIAGVLIPEHGTITFGHNVHKAYFQQDQTRVLAPNSTVFDEVKKCCFSVTEQTIRTFLGSFLFTGDDVHKKIKVLSGGEKNRVAMVKVLLQGANFLLLDEPTNHLDIYAKDILVQALQQFDGTLLFVSHDHDVIERVATVVYELTAQGLITFEGTYEEYLYYKKNKDEPLEQKKDQAEKKSLDLPDTDSSKSKRMQVRELEKKIQAYEREQQACGLSLADYEYDEPEYKVLLKKLQKIEADLAQTTSLWEQLMRDA